PGQRVAARRQGPLALRQEQARGLRQRRPPARLRWVAAAPRWGLLATRARTSSAWTCQPVYRSACARGLGGRTSQVLDRRAQGQVCEAKVLQLWPPVWAAWSRRIRTFL